MENNNTPKVTGIGGVFFSSEDLQKTKDWYVQNLGMEINDWGSSSFETRGINDPEKITKLQWKPFKSGDKFFEPSQNEFMINYQVQNLEGLIAKFKENGVTILDEMAVYDFGKFIHILDADGNKLQLWEPS